MAKKINIYNVIILFNDYYDHDHSLQLAQLPLSEIIKLAVAPCSELPCPQVLDNVWMIIRPSIVRFVHLINVSEVVLGHIPQLVVATS
jgi:hypothetical protein